MGSQPVSNEVLYGGQCHKTPVCYVSTTTVILPHLCIAESKQKLSGFSPLAVFFME